MQFWFCAQRKKIPIEKYVEGDGISLICAYYIPGSGKGLACDSSS